MSSTSRSGGAGFPRCTSWWRSGWASRTARPAWARTWRWWWATCSLPWRWTRCARRIFRAERRDAALGHFLRYITDTGAGEIYDILLGTRDIARVSEDDIARMYTLKTTRYTFEAPLVLGALLAGASDEVMGELSRLIEPVGLAFQIQNDLIEYQKFKGVNRLRQTDLLEGKKTLLLRAAFDHLDDLDRSFLQLCLSTRTSNDTSVSKIEQLIDKSGRGWTADRSA